jgi:hypothetical protein
VKLVATLSAYQLELWRPTLPGWSHDILPFYARLAGELPPAPSVVEVGVAWGRSLVFLASRLAARGSRNATLWAVDSWAPVAALWIETDLPRAAGLHKGKTMLRVLVEHATDDELAMLRVLQAESVKAANLFAFGSLDVVFVDADHSRAAEDLSAWASKVKPGGLLCGHDYHPSAWPQVVADVDHFTRQFVGSTFEPLAVEGTVWTLRKR